MDSPFWTISGGFNSDGQSLILGIVLNRDHREEDRRSLGSINIVMEDNVSMLSAIAEVTEPLSEAPNVLPDDQNSESKSLVAEFNGQIGLGQKADSVGEPHVEHTFQLSGIRASNKSFDSIGDQNSITEISEISREEESKQIESLVDELIGGVITFEAHGLPVNDLDKKVEIEESNNESIIEGGDLLEENVVGLQVEENPIKLVDDLIGSPEELPQENVPTLNTEDLLEENVIGVKIEENSIPLVDALIGSENDQISTNNEETLTKPALNFSNSIESKITLQDSQIKQIDVNPSIQPQSSIERSKLDTLIEQLTIPEDENVETTINSEHFDDDEYLSDSFQPKSREHSPATSDKAYQVILERAYINPRKSIGGEDERFPDSSQPKSREQSPDATSDPIYSITLKQAYVSTKSQICDENNESIVNGGLNSRGNVLINGIIVQPLSVKQDKQLGRQNSAPQNVKIEPTCESDVHEIVEGSENPGQVENQSQTQIETNQTVNKQVPLWAPMENLPLDGKKAEESLVESEREPIDQMKLETDLPPRKETIQSDVPPPAHKIEQQQNSKPFNDSAFITTRTPAPFIPQPKPKENDEEKQLPDNNSVQLRPKQHEEINREWEKQQQRRRSSVELPATPQSFHSFCLEKQVYSSPRQSQLLQVQIDSNQQVPIDNKPLEQKPSAPISPNAKLFQKSFHSSLSPTSNSQTPLSSSFVDSQQSAPNSQVNRLLSNILTRLRHLQMEDPSKYENIVDRLHALESEMSLQNSGLPPDPELTEIVGKILSNEYPHHDLQIVVSTSRKTTSSTQFYETETPGMVGLAPDQLRELQNKLMTKISGTTDYGTSADTSDQPDGLKHRDANVEGWTTGDGKESVTKKTIREVKTTHSDITGAGEHAPPKDQLIRLKVNRQVYDGQLDPSGHHIRLIPIQLIPVKYY